ncbi:MAG TPA: formyltransferase family protein [Candidatus Eremiobacteraceae bacterium]|nr:formyltransferase family protein [Candidatus Eremiobacteraceae bacterium]
MIYHFCNDEFGGPFRTELAAFSRASGIPLTTVYSAKTTRAALRRRLSLIGARLRGLFGRVVVARDVNAPAFAASIADGDIGVVSGFNQIFKAPAIARFRLFVNVHPSVLPMYRGRTPVADALRRGETRTGYTIHHVTPQIDSGPIVYQAVLPLDSNDVDKIAAAIGASAAPQLRRFLESYIRGEVWQPVIIDPATVYRST